jgi:hypothetical protein
MLKFSPQQSYRYRYHDLAHLRTSVPSNRSKGLSTKPSGDEILPSGHVWLVHLPKVELEGIPLEVALKL